MCYVEVVADRYTVCQVIMARIPPAIRSDLTVLQHLEILYETGNVRDCGNEGCKASSAHKHRAPNCGCAAYRTNDPRIRNQFRTYCPACTESMPAPSRSRR
ncbi:hypothetical protein C8F04DRAFT_170909 [Mycena alexandri]|uniref:Uncharacterized protein n=1 Tax=Mycena alexandri TaxID=1745969 RepID=A0AAD6T9X1_9AGAR|nr:hypothetical protein C8F04DRAFT_170909 [Mycena alexandri]